MMKEKVYVYIGRFQTAHIAHEDTIKQALAKCERLVIMVGSSELARDPKNPFTFEERKKVLERIIDRLIAEEWSKGRQVKYNILPLNDFVYDNNKWLQQVHRNVSEVTKSKDITITGCNKDGDSSTFYLQMFPQWKQDFVEEMKADFGTINSTIIRSTYFDIGHVSDVVCPETKEFMEAFVITNSKEYQYLTEEHKFIVRYRQQMMDTLPYTTIPFLTGDAVVVAAGHVLIGVRRTQPGKDLYCIAGGGFMDANKDKDQVDTAIRELYEETKINVPEKVLRGNIRSVTEFGDFNRSLRWRIITKAVYIQLPDTTLPKVKGSDDLRHCFWMPLGDLDKNRANFFEDHYQILKNVIGL